MPQISIEITYLTPHKQISIELSVPQNTTLFEAIKNTQLLQQFPEIDLSKNKVGIFGKIMPLETPLKEGDRIEIYRPLLIDPKQKRILKVKQVK